MYPCRILKQLLFFQVVLHISQHRHTSKDYRQVTFAWQLPEWQVTIWSWLKVTPEVESLPPENDGWKITFPFKMVTFCVFMLKAGRVFRSCSPQSPIRKHSARCVKLGVKDTLSAGETWNISPLKSFPCRFRCSSRGSQFNERSTILYSNCKMLQGLLWTKGQRPVLDDI